MGCGLGLTARKVKGLTLNHFFFSLSTGQLSETTVATAQQAEGAGVACLGLRA